MQSFPVIFLQLYHIMTHYCPNSSVPFYWWFHGILTLETEGKYFIFVFGLTDSLEIRYWLRDILSHSYTTPFLFCFFSAQHHCCDFCSLWTDPRLKISSEQHSRYNCFVLHPGLFNLRFCSFAAGVFTPPTWGHLFSPHDPDCCLHYEFFRALECKYLCFIRE